MLPLITGTLWTTAIALAVASPSASAPPSTCPSTHHPGSARSSSRSSSCSRVSLRWSTACSPLTFVSPIVLREWFGIQVATFSVLAAGLVLGVMIIPTVASLAEDAMTAVPRPCGRPRTDSAPTACEPRCGWCSLRPSRASQPRSCWHSSRAVGETMIVAMAAGSQAKMVTDPLEGGQTMTGFIASAAPGDSVPGSLEYNTLFAVGITLFVLTLIINLISIRLVSRFREIY